MKKKIKGKLRKFLILTGVSSVGFLVSVVFHNLFYALAVVTKNIIIIHYLAEILHVIFFIIAVFLCPIGFLIGVMGSIIFLLKN